MAAETATRRRIEARLDDLVADNRFTIAVVFPIVGAVLLLASAEALVGPPLRYNPALILLGTVVMRLPLVAGLVPVLDRRASLGLAVLVAYAFGIELIGVTTGWPYGTFEYTIALGPMLAGVPLGLPVFFLPLVLNSYLLCLLVLGDAARRRAIRLVVVIATVLLVDLVLDPGAVAIGFWSYGEGVYYGVPVSNYLGWVLSATVTVFVLDLTFDRTALRARLDECGFMLDDLVSFVVLWGGINAYFGNWIPVALALVLAGGLLKTDRFDFAVGSIADSRS
ncbi:MULTISPECIES: bisanhydrobacterioruberin hydratase [Halococcus]|uniref:Carotene biosynthesis associated membrane protein n=1 Tax=Halococcus salifodinae DSM 8989 TaxID=1227456 RepID=M0N6D9_9EURY|nr:MULTISPECIES: bisanhydrobacterioruberin hydratase [Halococcus]EMA53487.1 carotene biosynthesis associated membrane protein [Halococcus salifodinae DSM 8989]